MDSSRIDRREHGASTLQRRLSASCSVVAWALLVSLGVFAGVAEAGPGLPPPPPITPCEAECLSQLAQNLFRCHAAAAGAGWFEFGSGHESLLEACMQNADQLFQSCIFTCNYPG